MFEGLQTARMKVQDWMENADVRTMRLVLLPSRSISNYEKFTGSDKVFLIPSAIKADTPSHLAWWIYPEPAWESSKVLLLYGESVFSSHSGLIMCVIS